MLEEAVFCLWHYFGIHVYSKREKKKIEQLIPKRMHIEWYIAIRFSVKCYRVMNWATPILNLK